MSTQPLNPYDTSTANAIALALAGATAMVETLNNGRLKTWYDSAFESWKTTVLAGKTPNTTPPQPPMGYEVVKDAEGWPVIVRGTKPVCEPRTDIPPDYSKPFELVLPEPEHVRNVPKGDTMPVGYVAIDAEGRRWQKQYSVTPFGVAYFYQRVG